MVTRTKKIFVGGLSAPTTLEDVKNYFEQFGPVSTYLIIPLKTQNKHLLVLPITSNQFSKLNSNSYVLKRLNCRRACHFNLLVSKEGELTIRLQHLPVPGTRLIYSHREY